MKKTRKLATAVAAFALSFAMVPSAIAADYSNPAPGNYSNPAPGSYSNPNGGSNGTLATQGDVTPNGTSAKYGDYTFSGDLSATRDGQTVSLDALKYGDILVLTTKPVVTTGASGKSFDTIQNVTLHSNPVNLGNKFVPAGQTTTFTHRLGCELQVGKHTAELTVYPKGETAAVVNDKGFSAFTIKDKAENCGKFDKGFQGPKTGAVASVAAVSAGALAAAGAGIVALRRRFS
ncbi:LPXTG cell wall anchor domain-containing protein [Varibaculum prostatecancerukia]|uniref:LPXTG cell wall anchor domain-containing protein n=1 Tax=Varibaculum prostatecancerukia TaxID=2811781 RepID=UPI001C000C4F|nr:LPXTG cell wall anchor domain-containing protein [Varibaculum prostatecancerukia]